MKSKPIDVDFVRANYEMMGPSGCARALGVSVSRIGKVAARNGIRLSLEAQSRLKSQHATKSDSKCRVRSEQFKRVISAEVAYLLGLIWADGHVSKDMSQTAITQTSSDMVDISKALIQTGEWRLYTKNPQSGRQPATVAIAQNRHLGRYLVEYGYRSKSLESADKILSTIPAGLQHYFFRGLFDGDGSLRSREQGERGNLWCIASGYDQDWSYMIALCQRLRIGYTIHRMIQKGEMLTGRHNRGSVFAIRRLIDIRAMMDYLYRDRERDDLGLRRKWLAWQRLSPFVQRHNNNRHVGVTRRERNRWLATIPCKWGVTKTLRVGTYATEEEAYAAQQAKLVEMNIVVNRERRWGEQYRAVS